MYIKFLHIYKKRQPVQNLYKVQTKNGLKLEMYTNNVQTNVQNVQNLYN